MVFPRPKFLVLSTAFFNISPDINIGKERAALLTAEAPLAKYPGIFSNIDCDFDLIGRPCVIVPPGIFPYLETVAGCGCETDFPKILGADLTDVPFMELGSKGEPIPDGVTELAKKDGVTGDGVLPSIPDTGETTGGTTRGETLPSTLIGA